MSAKMYDKSHDICSSYPEHYHFLMGGLSYAAIWRAWLNLWKLQTLWQSHDLNFLFLLALQSDGFPKCLSRRRWCGRNIFEVSILSSMMIHHLKQSAWPSPWSSSSTSIITIIIFCTIRCMVEVRWERSITSYIHGGKYLKVKQHQHQHFPQNWYCICLF